MDTTYTTADDVRSMVVEALGDFAADYDTEGITAEVYEWVDGKIVITAEGDKFWEVVGRHDISTLAGARSLHQRVQDAEALTASLRSERDNLIREAITKGTTMYAIAKHLGISEQAVARIRDRG